MALIPKQDLIKSKVDGKDILQKDRTYIGMSGLNSPCLRKQWYDFRWAYYRYISAQLQRIFERGDLEEARIVKDLRKAGMLVSGDQQEMIDETGHIKGHIDGLVSNVPGAEKTEHLLEIKTMNDKRFKTFKAKGLAVSDPTYWGQIHTYMGELKLKRCLFVVTNKNNEERYYKRYEYDNLVHDSCMEKGFEVLTSETPPKRIGQSTWFECKFCNAKHICHENAAIKKSCRTCKHVDILDNGVWDCSFYGRVLSAEAQATACDKYDLTQME